jgi:hypothetical protein
MCKTQERQAVESATALPACGTLPPYPAKPVPKDVSLWTGLAVFHRRKIIFGINDLFGQFGTIIACYFGNDWKVE